MKSIIYYFLSLSIICLAFSCSDDDDTNTGGEITDNFSSGVFIANEGPFGSGTGTISFINNDENAITDEVYATANDNIPLGNIVNDISINGDKAVIVVNNANKVIIADKRNMEMQHEITSLALPRFATFINDTECMISYWGADGVSGGVAKISVETGDILEDIPLRNGPERMLFKDDKLYVANSGGFGRDSIVHILNPTDGSLIEDVITGDNPIDLVSGMGMSVWVLGRGFSDFNEPANNTDGHLLRLNAQNDIRENFSIPNGSSNVEIDLDNNQLYFVSGLLGLVRVESFDNDILLQSQISINGSASFPYTMRFDDQRDILYVGDAGDFQSNGLIHLLADGDNLIETFTAGVIPTSIELVE